MRRSPVPLQVEQTRPRKRMAPPARPARHRLADCLGATRPVHRHCLEPLVSPSATRPHVTTGRLDARFRALRGPHRHRAQAGPPGSRRYAARIVTAQGYRSAFAATRPASSLGCRSSSSSGCHATPYRHSPAVHWLAACGGGGSSGLRCARRWWTVCPCKASDLWPARRMVIGCRDRRWAMKVASVAGVDVSRKPRHRSRNCSREMPSGSCGSMDRMPRTPAPSTACICRAQAGMKYSTSQREAGSTDQRRLPAHRGQSSRWPTSAHHRLSAGR